MSPIAGRGAARLMIASRNWVAALLRYRKNRKWVQAVSCHGRCLNIDLVKVDSGTEILGQVWGTLWQKSC